MSQFTLWLEFEQYTPPCEMEPGNDFCNAQVTIQGGIKYALNVWSREFALEELQDFKDFCFGLPDLVVDVLDRPTISNAVAEILDEGGFPTT